jgi:hypothetical protein
MSNSMLTSAKEFLSPRQSLWKGPLDLLQMVDEEALLVHVVAIVRLYVILDDLLLQDSKLLLTRIL